MSASALGRTMTRQLTDGYVGGGGVQLPSNRPQFLGSPDTPQTLGQAWLSHRDRWPPLEASPLPRFRKFALEFREDPRAPTWAVHQEWPICSRHGVRPGFWHSRGQFAPIRNSLVFRLPLATVGSVPATDFAQCMDCGLFKSKPFFDLIKLACAFALVNKAAS
jgi:hypothetical protein